MERELLITGIGGQGVQLCAQVLARAATLEGREVMYLGLYGGMMRGGNTDSTVVVADAPILAPPVVSRAWSAIAMHDDYWPDVSAKLRPGGLVLVNDTTFTSEVRDDVVVHRVPATTVATDLGSPLSGSMVMLGAFCTTTGIVCRGRADRGDAGVDPAVPHAAHRSQRTRAPRRRQAPAGGRVPRLGDCECLTAQSLRARASRAAAPSRSTSRTARVAICASLRARPVCWR